MRPCPPEHKPIDDDEIAWVVVTLRRTGLGTVDARAVHLRSEDEAHEVATLLSEQGPTWLLGLGFDEEVHHFAACRYGTER